MEFADIGPDPQQKFGDFPKIAGIAGIGVEVQIMQTGRHDIVG